MARLKIRNFGPIADRPLIVVSNAESLMRLQTIGCPHEEILAFDIAANGKAIVSGVMKESFALGN